MVLILDQVSYAQKATYFLHQIIGWVLLKLINYQNRGVKKDNLLRLKHMIDSYENSVLH